MSLQQVESLKAATQFPQFYGVNATDVLTIVRIFREYRVLH